MKKDMEKLAAVIGTQPDIIDKLDHLMTCPNDKAFIVCSYDDCTHYDNGACTIFTILDKVARLDGQPCDKYERLS